MCSHSPPLPGHLGPEAPAHTPGPLLPLGFFRAPALARSAYPRVCSPPLPASVLSPTPSLTVRLGASSLPPPLVRGGEGGGQRRGCDSSHPDQCQLQPRFSAPCQLALSSETEVEARVSLSLRGGAPRTPQSSTHPRGASPRSPASGCSGSRSSQELALVTAPGTQSPHPSRIPLPELTRARWGSQPQAFCYILHGWASLRRIMKVGKVGSGARRSRRGS